MKKLIASGLALACLATVSTHALAQSKQQRTCTNLDNVRALAYDKRKLDCADLGKLTLKEINAKGWGIVQIMSATSTYHQNGYVTSDIGWTVLIEK